MCCRYLTERAIIIILDVLILSFGWTAVVMTLLLIRGWFPFKTMVSTNYFQHTPPLSNVHTHTHTHTQKSSPVTRTDKAVAILGNIIGLYSVLTLCFFIWFTRLYVSWACIDDIVDVLLLCQLTNQIQCYSCSNEDAFHCVDAGLAECVQHPAGEPFHCLSPFYTIGDPHVRQSVLENAGLVIPCMVDLLCTVPATVSMLLCRGSVCSTTTLDSSHLSQVTQHE